jgi:vacuolar-type H+-ATPase subunit I/STV1
MKQAMIISYRTSPTPAFDAAIQWIAHNHGTEYSIQFKSGQDEDVLEYLKDTLEAPSPTWGEPYATVAVDDSELEEIIDALDREIQHYEEMNRMDEAYYEQLYWSVATLSERGAV